MKRGEKNRESAALRFLYGTALGRVLLRPLCSRWFSKLAGALLDGSAKKNCETLRQQRTSGKPQI